MLIDTHSHIYDEVFDGDRDAVVARAREAGVGRILLPAVDGHSYGAMFETARRYAGYCFPMMGLHPDLGQRQSPLQGRSGEGGPLAGGAA